MSETQPPRTHNLPDLAMTLAPDAMMALIAHETEPLRKRADELIGVCKRFVAAHPQITGEEADSKAAEVLAVCARFTTTKSGRADAARIALKAPILAAGQLIDGTQGRPGPFAKLISDVADATLPIRQASVLYKQKVERETREAAQAEADRQREQARVAEELASKGSSLVTMDQAAEAAVAADDAQRVASSSAADLTRTHGNDAGVSSLRYKRVVTVTSPADVPRIYCAPDIAAITRAAGKAGGPIPIITGVTIKDEPDLTVRR